MVVVKVLDQNVVVKVEVDVTSADVVVLDVVVVDVVEEELIDDHVYFGTYHQLDFNHQS